jgi:hypothetical protein
MTTQPAPRPTHLLTHLDAEWTHLGVHRLSIRELNQWRAVDSRFDGYASPAALIDAVRHGSIEESVTLCHALLGQVDGSPFAARCVLQVLVPGVAGILARWLGQAQRSPTMRDQLSSYELDVELVSAAHTAISERAGTEQNYPIRRLLVRARQCAQYRIKMETRHDDHVELDPELTPATESASGTEDLLEVLVEAVNAGALSAAEAHLVAVTRCFGKAPRDLVGEFDLSERTLRRRRQRIEARLPEVAAQLAA